MELQQLPPIPTAETDSMPMEIKAVPHWVKGIVAVGIVLFAIQLPNFSSSLTDAITKSRAASAEENGRHEEAIKLYADLRDRYPSDNSLIRKLAFSQYHAEQYAAALATFELLSGVKMSKTEVEEINKAIVDIVAKLKLNN